MGATMTKVAHVLDARCQARRQEMRWYRTTTYDRRGNRGLVDQSGVSVLPAATLPPAYEQGEVPPPYGA